jgi:hypothetical protein
MYATETEVDCLLRLTIYKHPVHMSHVTFIQHNQATHIPSFLP